MDENITILTINAGSSSIKFSLHETQAGLQQLLSGKIVRIGLPDASLLISQHNQPTQQPIAAAGFAEATMALIDWFEKQPWFAKVNAVGHRMVHGLQHTHAEVITSKLLHTLKNISPYDPDHLPAAINIIQAIRNKQPDLLQVACFDTAFHTTIPAVARSIAIPKKYTSEGIRRYGFHGISYSYLMRQLYKEQAAVANGKLILAHLGNGASLAAVNAGTCVDTSMGFTPAGGIVMSTRSGDLDPGIAWYLMQQGMDANTFNELINHQSGLLGLSGLSADMHDLLQQENDNEQAALAIAVFCYQIIKFIGAYTAVLGGLDAIVFSGGIGENAAAIRSRISKAFRYMGLVMDEQKNNRHERIVSAGESNIKVFVIPTNEEWMIAETTAALCQPIH